MISRVFPHIPKRFKFFHKSKRTIIHCSSTSKTIIAIKITLDESYSKPIGNKSGESDSKLLKHLKYLRGKRKRRVLNLWVFFINQVINNKIKFMNSLWGFGLLNATREKFNMTHS
jgi:hypothetical protein